MSTKKSYDDIIFDSIKKEYFHIYNTIDKNIEKNYFKTKINIFYPLK